MQGTSSRISREEQVKVVIRLKPEEESKGLRCVYLSQLENQLVVETDLKKEIFVFDHVAHMATTQLDIYKTIGKEAVSTSFEGYNCSIFAYGQTGAGKTYSIMGSLDDLQQNIYCDSRGILPRLIEDIIQQLNSNADKKYTLTCSYIEIYNQQIFDLLSADKRSHHIRESKKGVFIEGLKECHLTSYKQGIQLIMEGENSRKMAITTMNTQSSRSHVIFTIFIQSETMEEDRIIVKKSKLNVIDLAGSERIKHTNVEGQRLKEGCNINRSLHVLANVINSLVESAKKKKYIPYRDSKLTYYLKDSLGGNSITKMLANIHCGREYFGDTLSTLMFAKRIKNLKLKVELNINQSDNFNNLRQQVRRLREELAQARYFKNQSQKQNENDLSVTFEKVTTDNTDYEVAPKLQIIQIFQQNELHYKSLIQLYQAHMKECTNKPFSQRRNSINMVGQWKSLESKNNALTGLLKRVPAFTKIYKENIILKQSKPKEIDQVYRHSLPPLTHKHIKFNESILQQQKHQKTLTSAQLEEISKKYEGIIAEAQQKFITCLQVLEKNYLQLETQCKRKDQKIRSILKNSGISPDLEELQNENEYLHLNILNLQNQISKLQHNQTRLKIQHRESKRNSARNSKFESFLSECDDNEEDFTPILEKLKDIQSEALREVEIVESEKKEMEHIINELRNQINSLVTENNKLQRKYERSRSRKSNRGHMSNSTYITPDLCFPKLDIELSQKSNPMIQSELRNFQQSNTKEILQMRLQIKTKQKQIIDLRNQIDRFMFSDFKIEEEFGKNVNDIVEEYREMLKRQKLKQQHQNCRIPKSIRSSHRQIDIRYEATSKFDTIFIGQKGQKKNLQLNGESRGSKAKAEQRKREEIKSKGNSSSKNSKCNSNMTSKSNSFFHL